MAKFTTKTQFLDDFLEKNPDWVLPYDTVQLNYDYLKNSFPIDSKGNAIDWDNMVDEPSAWEIGSKEFQKTLSGFARDASAYSLDMLSEPFEFTEKYLGVGETQAEFYDEAAENIAKNTKAWRDNMLNDEKYGAVANYLAENPYANNAWTAKQNAAIIGNGLASVLTTTLAAKGAAVAGSFFAVPTGIAAILGTGVAMFGMEAGSEYGAMFEHYAKDREVNKETFDKHLDLFKKTDEYKKAPFAIQKQMEAKFLLDNYKIDREKGTYTRLGMTGDEVRDMALLSGSFYGLVSSGWEMTLGQVSNKIMGIIPKGSSAQTKNPYSNSIKAYFADKFATKISFLPKVLPKQRAAGAKYINRLLADKVDDAGNVASKGLFDYTPLKPTNFGKVAIAASMEGVTEMTQLISQNAIASGFDEKFGVDKRVEKIIDNDELFQAFHSGALIGGGIPTLGGTKNLIGYLGQDTKLGKSISQTKASIKNQFNIRKALGDREQLFYYKKIEDGEGYALGTRTRLETDAMGNPIPKDEQVIDDIVDEREFGRWQEEVGIKTRFETKEEAQHTVEMINNQIRKESVQKMLIDNQTLIDGQVSMVKLEDGGFRVTVLDKDGKEIQQQDFDNRRDARKATNIQKDNIRQTNELRDEQPDFVKGLAEKTQERLEKSDVQLVLDDFVNQDPVDSNSPEGQRLNALLPSNPKERLEKQIEILTDLNEEAINDYIDSLDPEEGITVEEIKSDIIREASELDIDVDPDNLFTGEQQLNNLGDTAVDDAEPIIESTPDILLDDITDVEDTSTVDIYEDEVDTTDEVKFKAKGLNQPATPVTEETPAPKTPTPKKTLDITKPVDTREFNPSSMKGGNVEAYTTEQLEDTLENADDIYGRNSVNATLVKKRIERELNKRYIDNLPDDKETSKKEDKPKKEVAKKKTKPKKETKPKESKPKEEPKPKEKPEPKKEVEPKERIDEIPDVNKDLQFGDIPEGQEIYDMREEKLNLSGDQKRALNYAADFINGDTQVLKIAGYAGTGKTTIIENIAKYAKDKNPGKNIYLSAFTNKAVLNLENKTNSKEVAETKTLHSLLYGAPDEITGDYTLRDPLKKGDIVIIDEASMVGQKMMKDIQKNILNKGAKVIFIGDTFQLPPVKDKSIFETFDFQLENVQRQGLDSPILSIATAIRLSGDNVVLKENNDNFKLSSNIDIEFINEIANPNVENDIVYVTDINKKRKEINTRARTKRYKDASLPLQKNDKIIYIANSKYHRNGQSVTVNSNDNTKMKFVGYVKAVWLKSEWDSNANQMVSKEVSIELEHYKDVDGKDLMLSPGFPEAALAHQAIYSEYFEQFVEGMDPKEAGVKTIVDSKGKRLFSLNRDTDIATYGYAITAHKSQGSEWSKVYVNQIMENPRGWESENWLYTAITRAKQSLVLEDKSSYKKLSNDEISNIANKATDESDVRYSIEEQQKFIGKEALYEYMDFVKSKFVGEDGSQLFEYEVINDPKKNWGGVYIADKKLMKFNLANISADTPFHEFLHPFIAELRVKNPNLFESLYSELFRELPNMAKSIEKSIRKNYKGKKAYDDEIIIRDEILVTALGRISERLYQLKKQNTKPQSKLRKWIDKVYKAIREFVFGPSYENVDSLTPLSSLHDVAKIMVSGNKIKLDGRNLVENIQAAGHDIKLYQITSPNSVFNMQTRRILRTAWKGASRYWARTRNGEQLNPFDFRDMIRDITKSDEVLDIVDDWFNSKFKKYPDFINKNKQRNLKGKVNTKYITEMKAWEPEGQDNFVEGIREGLADLSPDDVDFSSVATNEIQFYRRLNLIASQKEIDSITAKVYQATDFDTFLMEMNKDFPNMFSTREAQSEVLSFYLLKKNIIRINRNEVADNDRLNYNILTKKEIGVPEGTVINRSIHINTETTNDGSPLPQQDRNTLLERNVGYNIFNYLNFKDSETETTNYNQFDADGGPSIQTKRDYVFSIPKKKLFYDNNIAFIGTRGDSPKLLIAPIKSMHKDKASEILANGKKNVTKIGYWKEQIDKGFIREDDVLNYTSDFTKEGIAHEIAVHEAMIQVFPQYLKKGKGGAPKYNLETILKRIKIPTTPSTVSEMMPDYEISLFDKKRVTFVYSKEIKAMQGIDGVDYKYIGDGGSFTSSKMMKTFNKAFGVKNSISTGKTIIYGLDRQGDSPSINDGVVMIKHNQFLPEKGLKIYYDRGLPTERLYAEVDRDGNIYVYDKDGNKEYRDMLLTDDEAKILEGSYLDDMNANGKIKLKGNTLGFIKSHDKVPKNSTHLTQWYNHIDNPSIINAFENNIMKVVNNNLRNKMSSLFIESPTNSVVENMEKLYTRYDSDDKDVYFETNVEHAKNGAGLHISQSSSLKQIVRNTLIKPNINLSKMDGTKSDIVPNTRGDLSEGEIAMSFDNARVIREKVKNKMGESNFIKQGRLGQLQAINEYLKENEEYVMISRSPVPHAGGVMMARVKRLHFLENQIMIHHNDIFIKLEADSDGDTVQIEFLNEPMTKAYKEWFDNQTFSGISLEDYKRKIGGASLSFSNEKGRRKAVKEIVTGSKAVGELANLQTVYGILNYTVNSINVDGQEIFMRKFNDPVKIGKITNENMSTALRILLQAAVDNNKYMMIDAIGYTSNDIYTRKELVMSKMFVDKNGNDISPDTAKRLIALIDSPKIMKNVFGLSRLGDFDGKFTLDEIYSKSEDYNKFANNKDLEVQKIAEELDIGDVSIEFNKDINGDYILHPKEMLAVVVDKTKIEHEIARNTKSQELGPWDVNLALHKNTHVDAMNILNQKPLVNLLRDAAKRDNNITEAHQKQSRKDAYDYAKELISKIKDYTDNRNDFTQMDKNDIFHQIKTEMHEKFSQLSEVAKVYSTMMYLGDGTLDAASLATTIMPPASENKYKFNNLDWRTLNKYFAEYNKIINNPAARNFSDRVRSVDKRDIDNLIKEVCSV
jgi:ATP-dependent exoDNAse (exonuclease V) alpha subunit